MTPNGSVGDRAWALRDVTSGRIASAKKYPVLLNFRAKYVEEPTPSDPGRVLIEMPDGRTLRPKPQKRRGESRTSLVWRFALKTDPNRSRGRVLFGKPFLATFQSRNSNPIGHAKQCQIISN